MATPNCGPLSVWFTVRVWRNFVLLIFPAQSPDKIWSDLMDGNKRFVAGKPKPRALVSVRESLAKSQHPKATVLSCSDSRVPPESVLTRPWATCS
jgi:hypothetical protein